MTVPALALFVALAGPVAASPVPPQSPRAGGCTEWRQCRQLALEAAERHEYETFHDLAWRAVQTGNPKDPALLYLLARAQSLSGRAHDALVLLQRLTDLGMRVDAATNEDFKRTRDLPGWPELAEQIERLPERDAGLTAAAEPIDPSSRSTPRAVRPSVSPAAPAAPAAIPVPAPVAPPPAAVAVAPPPFTPAPVAEAVRFSVAPFSVAGLAYDAVSRRFLFGDRLGRKLIVVGDGSNQTSDLVHGDSAGFRDISAIEIDTKRGDLWVATSASGGGTLHRLQLISGRPLKAFAVDGALEPVTLVDLAVNPAGTVLVLDSGSRRLLTLRVGTTALEEVVQIGADEPVSVAVPDRDGVAYVAHKDGVSRIDLRARTATLLTVPKGASIGRLERIRWFRNALIALTVDADDTRRIVRLDLNGGGTAVSKVTTLEAPVPSTVQTFVTISGDDLIYLESGSGAASSLTELVAYRVRLR